MNCEKEDFFLLYSRSITTKVILKLQEKFVLENDSSFYIQQSFFRQLNEHDKNELRMLVRLAIDTHFSRSVYLTMSGDNS